MCECGNCQNARFYTQTEDQIYINGRTKSKLNKTETFNYYCVEFSRHYTISLSIEEENKNNDNRENEALMTKYINTCEAYEEIERLTEKEE